MKGLFSTGLNVQNIIRVARIPGFSRLQGRPSSVGHRSFFGQGPLPPWGPLGRCGTMVAAATSGGAGVGDSDGRGPRVCILGGGFGGLYTALKLDDLVWPQGRRPEITLVDRSDRFVFKPLLYELVAGGASEEEVAPTFSEVLAPTSVRFVTGSVAAVRTEGSGGEQGGRNGGGIVTLSDGTSLPYDWLVLALGSDVSPRGVPGAKEYAIPFNTFEDTVRVNEALARLESTREGSGSITVTVVGSGYAGVELAATLSERLGPRGRISVVGSGREIMDGAPEGQRRAALSALSSMGVDIVSGARVQSISQAAGDSQAPGATSIKVQYGDGRTDTLGSDLVLWTAGARPATEGTIRSPSIAMPFPVTDRGATLTDPTLRVLNHSRVFALGDVATVAADVSVASATWTADAARVATPLPQTAQVAFQQADYVAWNIWASINQRPVLPFRYQHLGDMMTLGRLSGAVALPVELPGEIALAVQASPLGPLLDFAGVKVDRGLTLTGPLAQALRRGAYLYRQPTMDRRIRVGASWLESAASQLGVPLINPMNPFGTPGGAGGPQWPGAEPSSTPGAGAGSGQGRAV